MAKKVKQIPKFKSEDEEREFWANHSPHDYVKTNRTQKVIFKNLKPSLKSISIRLPEDMLAELKNLANKRDVPYQSLIKIFLSNQIAKERDVISASSKRNKPVRMVRLD